MSDHIRKSHNVSLLLYHMVCPTKYRRAVIDIEVDSVLRSVCFDIIGRAYVLNQGRSAEYKQIHTEPIRINQLELF